MYVVDVPVQALFLTDVKMYHPFLHHYERARVFMAGCAVVL
jgi:hypothetical protein